MAHITLYRKYRPTRFADLVGQEVVARALRGAVGGGRVAHAYLFSGIRGTGKTSAARLLARALLCEKRDEGSGEPCNSCAGCQSVAEGAALDLVEIDAASNRGIDEIRDLRDRVRYLPAGAREGWRAYKLYIIDEAHMLTTEAFNALLKTLEEPPEHVVFVLCTTDVEKMPATVLGRCQRFSFRPLTLNETELHLGRIAEAEGARVTQPVLRLLAGAGAGSMRDAIGYLDQALSLGNEPEEASVRVLLGLASEETAGVVVDSVLRGDGGAALVGLTQLLAEGVPPAHAVGALVEQVRNRLLEATASSRPALVRAMDDLLWLWPELRHQPDPRPMVEAMLVKLAAQAIAAAQPVRAPAAQPVPQPPASADPGATGSVPPAASPPPEPTRSEPSAPPAEELRPHAHNGQPVAGLAELVARWEAVLAAVRARDVSTQAYLRDGRPAELAEGRLGMIFQHGLHCERVSEKAARERVEEAIREVCGINVRLDCKVDPEEFETPVRVRPEEHPAVAAALRGLGGGEITGIRSKGEVDGR